VAYHLHNYGPVDVLRTCLTGQTTFLTFLPRQNELLRQAQKEQILEDNIANDISNALNKCKTFGY